VVESTALEMRHTRKGIGGSNPSLSASRTLSEPAASLSDQAQLVPLVDGIESNLGRKLMAKSPRTRISTWSGIMPPSTLQD
jgi:hypothetical protein